MTVRFYGFKRTPMTGEHSHRFVTESTLRCARVTIDDDRLVNFYEYVDALFVADDPEKQFDTDADGASYANPIYNRVADVELANGNFAAVIEALGYKRREDYTDYEFFIDEFIASIHHAMYKRYDLQPDMLYYVGRLLAFATLMESRGATHIVAH